MGLKTFIRTSILCVAFSTPAVAQGLEPCGLTFSSSTPFFAALNASGWGASTPDVDLTEPLAWINAVTYLGGDMGGATLETVVSSQRMAAANYGRLKPLPTSETRIFTEGRDVLIASWQKPSAGMASVQCRLAVHDASAPTATDADTYGTNLDERTVVLDNGARLTEAGFVFNVARINADLPDARPPSMMMNMRHVFPLEVSP